ncbi:hypothetical protein [Noviherbaspirillum denitrificans]|uniref:Uncharacterized protein n=1 Tax=Noviherbaspirillum denitrificans TaxID=1968433 RepID=A0A254TLY9_9BURK|nr:hypothetical protein [Noviherbaspirillum denitrificans]OWW22352.1 hypothetical protein AYR66_25510 [Noviherbaspirillum denitrificans]
MPRRLSFLAAAGAALILAACGGGSADIASNPSPATQLRPTVWTSEGRPFSSCSLSPGCSGNPYAPFFAYSTVAPPAGASLSGVVRFEVRGNELANVELLAGSGYLPRYGKFNITGDRTVAWMDLDTTRLPNGPVSMRVSAFNVPAGQPGAAEIVAMQARSWTINNAATMQPGFSANVVSAPADGATVSGITRLEIRGSGIVNAELLPASGYTPRLASFNVSADRTMAWVDLDTRSLPDGVKDVRISAYNVTEGQDGASEIVAMPARRWTVANGTGTFVAGVTMAPVHGEIVGGRVLLEVRGSGMRNVELLPASGYTPRLGVFNMELNGTYAWLEVDASVLAGRALRISVFDVPPGQPNAREIVAMPSREWVLR